MAVAYAEELKALSKAVDKSPPLPTATPEGTGSTTNQELTLRKPNTLLPITLKLQMVLYASYTDAAQNVDLSCKLYGGLRDMQATHRFTMHSTTHCNNSTACSL